MAAKASEAQMEQRVTAVFELLTRGVSRAGILQYVAKETDWNVSERTIDSYIARANERFAEHAAVRRDLEFGKALRRTEYVYLAAMKVHDYQRALAALREINLLMGLYAPTKTEIGGIENGAPIPIVVGDYRSVLTPLAPADDE